MTHIIWHPIHIASLSSTNGFTMYEVCSFCRYYKSPKKYVPPPLTITHPMIWSIFYVNFICNIDWSHPKILHMNDIEKIKCHIHSLLLYFTLYFLLGGIPLDIVIHSLNNVRCICVINTKCKHIWTCCVNLHHRHFYFSYHFLLFLLLLTYCWIIYSGTHHPCVLATPCNSLFSVFASLHNLVLLYKSSIYTWFHSFLRRF